MLISREKLNLAKYAPTNPRNLTFRNLYLDGDRAAITNGDFLFILEGKPVAPDDEFPDTEDGPHHDPDDYTPDKDLISKQTAEKVLKNLPKKSTLEILKHALISRTKGNVSFTTNDLENTTTVRQREIEGTYPNIDALDKVVFPSESVSINVDYLFQSIKALKEFSNAPVSLNFFKGESTCELEGILLESVDEERAETLKAYIMRRKKNN